MCGVAGSIGNAGRGELEIAARGMANAIAHRGPDDHGIWVDAEAGVALAHRRLSIIDLSPAGHQPMVSACGRFVLTFNGEIYNHTEMRAELARAGQAPPWRGHSDTEVLLASIAARGVRAALERTVGMFAFGLWDRADRSLTLARDRLGEKPLYYGFARRTFLFGSELAALAAHPSWCGVIDRNALSLLLRFNYIPAPYTIYEGIAKLPPGTFLVLPYGAAEGRIETYWDAAAVAAEGTRNPFRGSPGEAVDQCEALIVRSLQGQMVADVPLGAFLSGGIDSSTVVALMQSLSSRPVKTFSIGFREKGYDEAPHAKAVARQLGTDHTELYVTMAEAMDIVPELPTMYSEPFADASQIPTALISRLARRKVTVALSGDGGDELFSGYTRYRLADRLWRQLSYVPGPVRRASAYLARSISPAQYNRFLQAPLGLLPESVRPTHVGDKVHKAANVVGLRDDAEVYQALVSLWQHPDKVVIGAVEPLTSLKDAASSIEEPVRRMMYFDQTSYLPDDILVKVDRASMAMGLEARAPLLDHRLIEFTWSLPLDLLRRDGQSKWPLRQIVERHVPRSIINRPKMGFGVPIDSWLRGGLKDWAEALLDVNHLKAGGLFHPEPIRAAWRAHLDGHRNLQHQLWGVLMFQAWHEAHGLAPTRTASPAIAAGA